MKRTSIPILLLTAIFLAVTAAAFSSGPEEATITIEDPWARPGTMKMESEGGEGEMGDMPMAGTSAIFMVIHNEGQEDDRLIAVSGDVAEFVEMHTTETREGVSMMAKIDGIDIPGGKEVVLKKGGLHIMLINLNQNVEVGDTVTVELEFEQSGLREVTAEVRAP